MSQNVTLIVIITSLSQTLILIVCLGAVFALMKHTSVCQEMVRDFLLDLPLLSSPVILLCMNKELRNQCLLLLQRNPNNDSVNTKSISNTAQEAQYGRN